MQFVNLEIDAHGVNQHNCISLRKMRVLLMLYIASLATTLTTTLSAYTNTVGTTEAEDFREELYIRKATHGATAAHDAYIFHFQFTTRWLQNHSIDDFHWQHFNLFPKPLGQAIYKLGIEELHLAFSKGAWKPDHWGYPFESAPSGLELWSIFEDKAVESEYGSDAAWTRIVRHFSGSFCASLEQLGGQHAASPSLAFGSNLTKQEEVDDVLALRYGQLPMEVSCTENLTPWFKLLPTRSRAGFAKFLVPSRIYDAMHHTMTTHFRKVCYDEDRERNGGWSHTRRALRQNWQGCAMKVAELVQSFTVVFRRDKGSLDDPLQLLTEKSKAKDTMMVLSSSRVASRSFVFVETSAGVSASGEYDVISVPLEADQERSIARFDLKKKRVRGEDIEKVASLRAEASTEQRRSTVEIKRATFGTGQVNGGISCVISADLTDLTGIPQVKLRILELVPAFMRIRPSTINVTVEADGEHIPHLAQLRFSTFQGPPGTLEYEIDVGGRKSVTIYFHYEFDKAFQNLDAFPPDANRGFDVPATLVVLEKASGMPFFSDSPLLSRLTFLPTVNMRVYSSLLLISMPLPDFSMPFNVITLSSTIVALIFGNVLNALARRVDKDQAQPKKQGLMQRLKGKLTSLKSRFMRKGSGEVANN